MAIAKISKINILASLEKQKEIMEAIQDFGFVQIEEHDENDFSKNDVSEELGKVEYKLAGAKFGLNFLAEYENKNKKLSQKINSKIILTKEKVLEKVINFNYKTFKEIQEVQRVINEAHNIIKKNEDEISLLLDWKNLKFVPSYENFPSKIKFRLISISPIVFEKIKEKLNKKLPLSELQIVKEDKKELKASMIFHVDCEKQLLEILNEFGVRIEEIPDIKVSVSNYIANLEKEIEKEKKVIEKEEKVAQKLAQKTKDLKIIHDYYSWEKDRLLAQQKGIKGQHFFSLSGWIEKEKIKELEKEISLITDKFFIEELKIKKEEQAPIVLKNHWWSAPFEFVTGIYGYPKGDSPDPTPFLVPFFVVFFGLCLTDAGYGIILALLSWVAIKLIKPTREAKKIFIVLIYGGLLTFLAGALVGGWFGIVIDDLENGSIKNLLTGMRIIDPVKDPIIMLIFSLILGVIQILTGIVVSFWWKIKNNNIKAAFLDDGMWLFFLISLMTWGMDKFNLIDFSFSKYLVWIGVIGIITTQGRKVKNPFLRIANGVLSLYGLVGYLSDVLSYSRLLALGLATGIIAMVVNLIAGLAIEMVPYLGYVIALLIIVGGHAFNIAINALGSFIHSSRLQFVEFFPKFMEGGGVSFAPIKRESRYIKII